MTPQLNPHSKRLLDELVKNARQHGLVLFVGAGVNARAIRQWGGLLQRLVECSLKEASSVDPGFDSFPVNLATWTQNNFDTCSLALLAKSILGPDRFRLEIQDALYETLPDVQRHLSNYCNHQSPEEYDKFEFLRVTASLASSQHVRAVATFNYDNLLETAVRQMGLKHPRPYFGRAPLTPPLVEQEKPVLPIFHVHGLLSPPGAIVRDLNESAVLSYDDYFDKNADPLSWETSTPIHLLRTFCTLWLGASLKDWNMLRLLHAAKSQRETPPSYCLMCLDEINPDQALQPPRPKREEPEDSFTSRCTQFYHDSKNLQSDLRHFQRVALRLQSTLLEMAGVKLIVGGASYSDIPKTVEHAINQHISLRAKSPTP